MSSPPRDWLLINQAVESFESAREDGAADLKNFLPPVDDPHFLSVLVELARVEMELDWHDRRQGVEQYLARFPALTEHPRRIEELACEEIRQRRLDGDNGAPEEYQRFGIDVDRLRELLAQQEEPPGSDPEDTIPSTSVVSHRVDRLPDKLPSPGAVIMGFQLDAELGRGAFSRVFLARQPDLAGRPVVLKLTASGGTEPQKLAQLQHTHIVPIYSLCRQGNIDIICMPYFGPYTLQHVITGLQGRGQIPVSASALLDVLNSDAPQDRPRHGELSPSVEKHLRGRTFVEGAVWIASCLARGLAHAHERGILHLDLKPANVLLADTGEPMLLDFNLAYSNSVQNSTIGGTLPYMAPEHLQALQKKKFAVDQRADIFSLGVVLYQFVTGRLPFKVPASVSRSDLPLIIELRSEQPIVAPRSVNPRISPAVEAIIMRCLHTEPAQRYSSATELAEDLECQLAHQPLRHTREPSLREAAAKWVRRHPRLSSAGSVACLAICALAVLAWLIVGFKQRLASFEADAKVRAFRGELQQIRYLLHAPRSDRQQLERGIDQGRNALARFRTADESQTGMELAQIDAKDQPQLRRDLAELLYLLVRASHKRWVLDGAKTDQAELARWARWNAQAVALYERQTVPNSIRTQTTLLQRLRDSSHPNAKPADASSSTPSNANDLYLLASDHLAEGQFLKARELLHEAIRLQPDHYWAWIAQGQCADALNHWDQAIACYSTGIALGSEYPWSYYLRGLAYAHAQQLQNAGADFKTAISKQQDWWEPHFAQSFVLQRLGNYQAAVLELDAALQHGGPRSRLLFMRSRLHAVAGDKVAAERDLHEARQSLQQDELAHVASGLARLAQDPTAALQDFDRALGVNPCCEVALQNKAHVLAEILEKPDAAVDVLDHLIAIYPDDVRARASRAVLLARLHKRTEALREAEVCLQISDAAAIEYQLAGVYALTSHHEPGDAETALELVQSALRRGWGRESLRGDRDLEPLRKLPQFQRLLAAIPPP